MELDVCELLQVLAASGWVCSVVVDIKQVREARKVPAHHTDVDKKWFLRQGQESILRLYLIALASVGEHRKPVPHFMTRDTYRVLLELPSSRKRRKVITRWQDEDEWAEHVAKTRKPRQPRGVRAKVRIAAADASASSSTSSGSGSDAAPHEFGGDDASDKTERASEGASGG